MQILQSKVNMKGCERMGKPKNVEGMRFGHLVAIKRTEKKGDTYQWLCKCDCGNMTEVLVSNLTSGSTKSCGCMRKPPVMRKHGFLSRGKRPEKLYGVWVSMKQRCFNPNDVNFFRYGGRGISVCEEWKDDYEAFRNWALANGYKQGLELDRKDNDKGYSPENCRFVTHRENLLNTHRAKKYKERDAEDGITYNHRVEPRD